MRASSRRTEYLPFATPTPSSLARPHYSSLVTSIDNGRGHVSNQAILVPVLSQDFSVLNPNNRRFIGSQEARNYRPILQM